MSIALRDLGIDVSICDMMASDFDDDIFNTPNFLRHLTSCFGSEMSDGSASTDTYGRDSPSFAQFLSLAPSNTQESITSVSTHQTQSRGTHGKVVPSKPPLAKSPVQSPRFYAERYPEICGHFRGLED
eukprot:gene11173-12173_t